MGENVIVSLPVYFRAIEKARLIMNKKIIITCSVDENRSQLHLSEDAITI